MRALAYQNKIQESNNEAKWVNKLGVLYARYGLYDKAIDEFEKILITSEYVPALLNVGSIHFLREEPARTH